MGIIFAFKNEVFPEPGSPKRATKLVSASCLNSDNLTSEQIENYENLIILFPLTNNNIHISH